METQHVSLVKLETFRENIASIPDLVQHSLSRTKEQFLAGAGLFKEELEDLKMKAEIKLRSITLPINNFLKDAQQIENEILFELKKEALSQLKPTEITNMIPIEQIDPGKMEENY